MEIKKEQVSIEKTKLFVDAFKHMATVAGVVLAFVLGNGDKLPVRGPKCSLGISILVFLAALMFSLLSLAQILSADEPDYRFFAWQLRFLGGCFLFGLVMLAVYTTYGLFFKYTPAT
jgi:hypothetical protein